MKAFSLLHPRDQIVAIMERIYDHEMTTTSGGNISVRDENGDVWITPARVEHQFGDGEEVAAIVGPKNPVALLENNGVMVAGRTVLDAFDRLGVLEATAAAIIRSRALGSISAMGPEVIQELLGAFPGL